MCGRALARSTSILWSYHGKIEKVDLKMYPNAWLSNPRITEKNNGDIRLNLDPKRPKKVILDNAESMLSPEEVRHTDRVMRLSEFDLRHGY